MVEVAHEALFRSWPRLADWIEETGSYGDIEAGWYWQSPTIPDLAELQAQHDALARVSFDLR